MPHRAPPKPPPIEVVDVGDKKVPFLRPLEWIAVALRSFRERPLPSTYSTEVQPAFDIFGSARLPEFRVEEILGALGGLEANGARVGAEVFRLYMSFAAFHTDAIAHDLLFSRVVPDPTLGFPTMPLKVFHQIPTSEWNAVENLIIPPDGRANVTVNLPSSMGVAARITLRGVFIEFQVGEPSQGCQGGSN